MLSNLSPQLVVVCCCCCNFFYFSLCVSFCSLSLSLRLEESNIRLVHPKNGNNVVDNQMIITIASAILFSIFSSSFIRFVFVIYSLFNLIFTSHLNEKKRKVYGRFGDHGIAIHGHRSVKVLPTFQ